MMVFRVSLALCLLAGADAFTGTIPSIASPKLRAHVAARRAPVSIKMGFFDNFQKAVADGLKSPASQDSGIVGDTSDLDEYQGYILPGGMREFTFDGKEIRELASVGQWSMAGQNAPKEPAFEAPRQQGWSPFGVFQKGAAGPSRTDKENQDGTLVKPYMYDGVSTFCIFDGHGENGRRVSEWCEKNMPTYLSNAIAEGRQGQLLNRITDAYRAADQALLQEFGYAAVEDSGTTMAAVMNKGDLLLIAGLGDSRVVLGLEEEGVLGAQAVTLDQSPSVAAERKRIEAAGGEVRGQGVGRVYAAGQKFPGLAVSRAFGDADGKKYGVTVDPQFIGWKIRPECDWCVIAASDGVWNAIGNENAVEICSRYRDTRDAQNAAREIVETSRKVWEGVAKGRIDDITAVVIYL